MPILISPYAPTSEWHGCVWRVENLEELADKIAKVAVGQSRHVAKIMSSGVERSLRVPDGARATAIQMLKAGNTPDHRDGWMFQVMSWLAANVQTPNALLKTPQMVKAEKGLDGLQIVLESNKHDVAAVVIFEDKATINPRQTVTQKVWPEFKRFEGQAYENLLVSEATAILAGTNHPDPDYAVSEIIWSRARQYRLSITSEKCDEAARSSIFRGYADTVPGDLQRRRAEVFEISDLRNWMEALAQLAIRRVSLI